MDGICCLARLISSIPGMILANEPARISRIPASILPGISSPWTIQASMGESAGLKKYTSETTLAGVGFCAYFLAMEYQPAET